MNVGNLFFVDVEASGPAPTVGLMTEFGAVHYETRETFHGRLYESTPHPDNPAIPVPVRALEPMWIVMARFAGWVRAREGGRRPVFVSDNNGYDAMWITCAFASSHLENPFGHSSRRIGDFYAGLRRNYRDSSSWKGLRVTRHTHDPVDDAMGNVEAFAAILESMA